jgi:hypothetical protein
MDLPPASLTPGARTDAGCVAGDVPQHGGASAIVRIGHWSDLDG